MARPFATGPEGGAVLTLDPVEREVVADLLGQLLLLLEERGPEQAPADPLAALVGLDGPAEEPEDPALARLFPSAYFDDDRAAADFRRYTEGGLRARKVEAARVARATLERPDPTPLDAEEAGCWLGALNDLRLVLGTRLGVTEDDDPDERASGPDAAAYSVYWWLSLAQERLLEVLDAGDDGEG